MNRSVLPIAAASVVCGTAACGGGPPAPPPPEPFAAPVQLYYDNGGGIQDSVREVVRDTTSLRRVWTRAMSLESAPLPMPDIDFDRQMVLVVAAGRMTPDDEIAVDSVVLVRRVNEEGRSEEVLNVIVVTTSGCRRLSVDAYPLEVVRLQRYSGVVEFVERRAQAPGCGALPPAGRVGPRAPAGP